MRKKKFTATAVALAMAAVTVFSVGNTPSVKAADVVYVSIKLDRIYTQHIRTINLSDGVYIHKIIR